MAVSVQVDAGLTEYELNGIVIKPDGTGIGKAGGSLYLMDGGFGGFVLAGVGDGESERSWRTGR
jgi:hypothetical protein